jgi:hypothetical protein
LSDFPLSNVVEVGGLSAKCESDCAGLEGDAGHSLDLLGFSRSWTDAAPAVDSEATPGHWRYAAVLTSLSSKIVESQAGTAASFVQTPAARVWHRRYFGLAARE